MPSLSNLTSRLINLSLKDKDLEMELLRKELLDLPKDLLAEIFSRLPAESLCQVKLVCKPFSNIIGSSSFLKQHIVALNNSKNNHGAPQLMCFVRDYNPSNIEEDEEEEYNNSATLQSVRYDDGAAELTNRPGLSCSRSMSSPVAANFMIGFVFYNFFGMVWHNGRCWLANPLLQQVLRLPEDDNIRPVTKSGPYLPIVLCYGMGYDDITNTYKIVRVSNFYKEDDDARDIENDSFLKATTHILELGTNFWREIPSLPPGKGLAGFCVGAYGDTHWLTSSFLGDESRKRIVSFDFKKEEFSWTPPPPGLRSSGKNSVLRLLTFRGSMTIVETYPRSEGDTKVEIWLMKDYATKEWVREYNLTVNMPHQYYWLWISATCGEWEHGIFFATSRTHATRMFVDLRSSTVNIASFPQRPQHDRSEILIMSCTASLISLKDLGYSSTDEHGDLELVVRKSDNNKQRKE